MPCSKKQRCDNAVVDNHGLMMMIVMKDPHMVNNEDEEEDSITSTIPVVVAKVGQCCSMDGVVVTVSDDDISLSSCESSSSSCSKKTRRVVHFDESKNKSYVDTQYNKSKYKNDLWYNALDYQQFKMTTMRIASKIAHADKDDSFARAYYKVLQRTYQACCRHHQSENHENHYMNISNNKSINHIFACIAEQEHVQQWIHAANSSGALLGVAERHAVHEIVLDRSHRRRQLIADVLEIQDFCKHHKHATDHDGQAAVAEMMRLASLEKSRPSRLFAQVMANYVL